MPWPLQQAKSHLLRFRNSPLKSGSFRWEANSWVRSIWFRRRSRSSKKKDPSLWFRAFSMTSRSSPASRLQPSRARWKLLFGLPQLRFLRDSESQFAQFFTGMIPVEGWKVGQAYKRAILGAQTGRVYKVD